VQLNVTAVMTLDQVKRITERLHADTPAIISVFAGRIADTGRDPVPVMAESVKIMQAKPRLGAHLGEPARAAQHLPGRRGRLPHHYRHQRHPQEAFAGGQGPRAVFARDRRDVLQGRQGRGLHHPIARGGLAMKFKNVLVTGGAGYVGSLLVPQLLDLGHKVTVYDTMYFGDHFFPKGNPNLKLVKGDIRETAKLAQEFKGIDASSPCLHLERRQFRADEKLSTSDQPGRLRADGRGGARRPA
jgi:hypothetical protein